MADLELISNFLNVEIEDRKLRNGRKQSDKNQYYKFDDYYIVKLTQEKWMIVSNSREVRILLRSFVWHTHNDGYAATNLYVEGTRTRKMFHQLYLHYEDGLVCDHINRVRYDNRFDNLRIVSQSENMRNITTPAHNKTGHIGISESIIGIIPYFRVRIVNNAGRKLAKTFNIQKLGRAEALRLAIEQRKIWAAQYNYKSE